MNAKELRRQIEDFLDDTVRIKTENDRTGNEDLLLEAGVTFSEMLLRYAADAPEGNARRMAQMLRDLRETDNTVRAHRNGKER